MKNCGIMGPVLLAVLAALQLVSGRAAQAGSASSTCPSNRFLVYRVTLVTHWSRELFPKQYPEWRPPAQWSKLIGRSHDTSYTLFRVGREASAGLKEFAESGKSDLLDLQAQGGGGVLDEFNAPAITTGEGRIEAEFFVDGNHSKVSLASRVVPSPDWFIGLDSLDLCAEGSWIDSLAIKVGPLDAGTDNGFTFTSPNWPTQPAEKISRITSQSPSHPANSFYYPEIKDLPPLATFYFVKVKQYELAEEFHLPPPFNTAPNEAGITESVMSSSPAGEKEEVAHAFISEEQNNETYRKVEKKVKKSGKTVITTSSTSGKPSALLKSLVAEYSKKENRGRNNRRARKTLVSNRPRACEVGAWSAWSACSKSCGIGESVRTRKVIAQARRGGDPCPPLEERQWCGSSRDCSHNYFDW